MKRKTLSFVLKLGVSVLLLTFLLKKIGLENFLNHLAQAKPGWILAGIASFLVSNFLGSLQWHLLMKRSGMRLPYEETLKFYFIGLFFNNFFLSNLGGDVFRIYYASRSTDQTAGAISTVFLDRFIGFTMLTFLSLIGGLLVLQESYLKTILPVLFVTLFFWFLIFLVFFNLAMARK